MVHEVALARPDIGIGERQVHAQRVGLYPLAILVVESFLCDLADIDLGVEVGGESLMVVAGIAVDDVERVDLIEMVLGSIGGIDAAHARVEPASQDGAETGLFEPLLVGPLPRILEVGLVAWLIVGGVEVVASAGQTSLHDGEVLIGQCQVDDQLGLIIVQELFELLHIVGIHLCCLDIECVSSLMDVGHDLIAFRLGAAGNHEISKHVGILCDFECRYGSDATGANHQYFAHLLWFL